MVLFQTIQFKISIVCFFLNVKNGQFQTIQFSIITQLSSIWLIDGSPGQSGPGSNGNKGLLHIPQSSSITDASPSNCLVSYLGHLLGSLTPLQ